MLEFVKDKDVSTSFIPSQQSIEALYSIKTLDLASSVPFVKIVRIDPISNSPDPNVLNVFMQRAPNYDPRRMSERYSERPAASISSITISTDLMSGVHNKQDIEMTIVVHRPSVLSSAFFGKGPDSVWGSLITPGEMHLLEYGWTGASTNGLVNGDGYVDRKFSVSSRSSIIFMTNRYTFSARIDGSIELKLFGNQTGDNMLQNMYLCDTLKNHEDVNVDIRENKKEKVPNIKLYEANKDEMLRIKIQKELEKMKGEYVKFIEVLNSLIAPVIEEYSSRWGYTRVDLKIGDFNALVPPLIKKLGGARPASIADFPVDVKELKELVSETFKKGALPTIRSFLNNMIVRLINKPSNWDSTISKEISEFGQKESVLFAQVMIKVIGQSTTKDRILKVSIFDARREYAKVMDVPMLFDDFSKQKIKESVQNLNIPYISLGHANSFIKESQFETIIDPQIQAVYIVNSYKMMRSRGDLTTRTFHGLKEELPNFHSLFSSLVKGNIQMVGNFVFDTFGTIWLDVDVDMWSGPFNITKRVDEIVPGAFNSSIEVISAGSDPLNTRLRVTKEDIKRKKEQLRLEKIKKEKEEKKKKKRASKK